MSDLYVPAPGTRVQVVEVDSHDPNPCHEVGDIATVGNGTEPKYTRQDDGGGWLYLEHVDPDDGGTWCRVKDAPADAQPGPYSDTGTPAGTPGVERVEGVRRTDGRSYPIVDAPARDSATRKGQPIATGVMGYFPKALAAVSEVSRRGNDKHNPGEPLHWAREKSTDEADSAVRHITDALAEGPLALDAEGVPHLASAAWRVLAWLERALEGDERWRGVARKAGG